MSIKNKFAAVGQYLSAAFTAPSDKQAQVFLFLFGAVVLAAGLSLDVSAQTGPGQFNDTRVAEGVNRILTYIEGSMGALIMIAAGLGAIMSAAFGQYRAALALLVVAVGAFILRSLVTTFFNDATITDETV